MEPSEYDNIARVEHQHWWYRGMAAISQTLLDARGANAAAPDRDGNRVLDAGCGPGGMLSALARYGHPTGLDLHPLALALAQVHLTSPYPLLQASILHLPLASGSLDLITTFDVLYHRAVIDDGLALAEFFRVLKPDGWLLIRVPALESLRGAHDRIVHTRQRYTQAELAIKLRQAGFRVQRLTYANTLLFPLIYLRRILAGRRPDPASDVELPTPILNRILEFILKVENQWLKHLDLPIGVSLFALAQKP